MNYTASVDTVTERLLGNPNVHGLSLNPILNPGNTSLLPFPQPAGVHFTDDRNPQAAFNQAYAAFGQGKQSTLLPPSVPSRLSTSTVTEQSKWNEMWVFVVVVLVSLLVILVVMFLLRDKTKV